jgi:hypothetical protein
MVDPTPSRLVLNHEPPLPDHRYQDGARVNRLVDLVAEVNSSLGAGVTEDPLPAELSAELVG